jgi:putative restriction endonuclease
MLLRSDVHTLFDRGYLTITPEYRLRVSRHLREDFDNGEYYLRMDGAEIWVPPRMDDRPRSDVLEWHSDAVYRG